MCQIIFHLLNDGHIPELQLKTFPSHILFDICWKLLYLLNFEFRTNSNLEQLQCRWLWNCTMYCWVPCCMVFSGSGRVQSKMQWSQFRRVLLGVASQRSVRQLLLSQYFVFVPWFEKLGQATLYQILPLQYPLSISVTILSFIFIGLVMDSATTKILLTQE